jgi:hypothetical protein
LRRLPDAVFLGQVDIDILLAAEAFDEARLDIEADRAGCPPSDVLRPQADDDIPPASAAARDIGNGTSWPKKAETCARPPFPTAITGDCRKVHAGRADEAGDEEIGRLAEHRTSGWAICWISPSFMMTIRSAIVMASVWSCVT